MRKYLFSSVLQVSPNNDYFVELKELAQPLPDTLVNKYREALEGVKDVSPETIKILEDVACFIELATSTLIPLTFIVFRIIAERPWELFNSATPSNEINRPLISTYSELYDILNGYKTEAAIRLLEYISSNSSLRSAIISAYKESDKTRFCDTIEKSGEDYTNYLNKIYILTYQYDGVDMVIEKFSSIKRGKISIDEFLDLSESDDDENIDIPSFEQIDKYLCGKSNRLKEFSEQFTPLQPIVSFIKDDNGKEYEDLSSLMADLASIIDKQEPESLSDSIENFAGWWSYIVLSYYNELKKGLLSKESEIIDDLICNSQFEEYICDIYDEVKKEYSDDNEIIESQETVEPEPNKERNLFLPLDFYNTRNRRHSETECIANIKQRLVEAGVKSLCSMIDFIAAHEHIENTEEQKRNFAFRLTGFHSDYALPEKVHWHGDTNILSFIIQKIYERGDWNNARRLIDTDNKLYNNSTLKRTSFEEQEFKTLFEKLFPSL